VAQSWARSGDVGRHNTSGRQWHCLCGCSASRRFYRPVAHCVASDLIVAPHCRERRYRDLPCSCLQPRRHSSDARSLSLRYAIAYARAAHAECVYCQALRTTERDPVCTTQLLSAVALWACPQRTTWCVLVPKPYSLIAAIAAAPPTPGPASYPQRPIAATRMPGSILLLRLS